MRATQIIRGIGKRLLPQPVKKQLPSHISKWGEVPYPDQFCTEFGYDREELEQFLKEGREQHAEIQEQIKNQLGAEYRLQYKGGPGIMPKREATLLYSLIRIEQPEVVVETGVAQGSSTCLILEGLEANGHGELYSIDLPKYAKDTRYSYESGDFPIEGFDAAVIPEGLDSGWLVPENLRHRWTLNKGRSTEHLGDVLASIDSLDIFIHDSEHSYRNILWELSMVTPTLSNGGWIWVDDSNWNDAFEDFTEGVNWEHLQLGRAGIIRKSD